MSTGEWETLFEDEVMRLRQHTLVKELHEFFNKYTGDLFIILAGNGIFSVYRAGDEAFEDWPIFEEEGRRFSRFIIGERRGITVDPEDLEAVKAFIRERRAKEGHE